MFTRNSKKRIFYFLVLFISLSSIFPVNAASLRAIIVADVADEWIGRGDVVDRDNMKVLITEIAKAIKLPLDLQVISLEGESITAGSQRGTGYEQVTDAVSNLTVQSDDIVIFFYSGHGLASEINKTTPWPRLAVEGQFSAQLLEMSWVKEELWKKNPRLLLVIADACNSEIETSGDIVGSSKGVTSDGYMKLFMGYKGYLLATSSSRGEASIATNGGGLFTRKLLSILKREADFGKTAKWESIIKQLDSISVSSDDSQHPQLDGSALKKFDGLINSESSPLNNSCPHPKGTCGDMAYWRDDTDGQCYCCSGHNNKKRPVEGCD